ncbi:MAG: MaoC family dehydratase N-terminal domain-containing protein [Chloroflexi bacterium]|nr:MaoC family dehydratase N-terminal domain-containing protein [Chloroflexota bacterium]
MAEQTQETMTSGFGYKDKAGRFEYGKITDAAVNALKARIGVERSRNIQPRHLKDMAFTPARIRSMAIRSGDYNPLYLDRDYACKSVHGDLVVPPWALSGIEVINARTDGMPGLHAWFRGTIMEWKRPLKVGDILIGKTYLRDVKVVPSRTSGQAVVQEYESIGTNQDGEEIGRVYTSWHRAEREASKNIALNQKMRGIAQYTAEDIEKIQRDYENEFRRGGVPLYWEDVQIGEELPVTAQGPTSQAQRTVGEGGGYGTGGSGDWSVGHKQVLLDLFEKHPGLPFINEWGIPEVPVVIHNSNERCQRYLGLPGAYDGGAQRVGWTIHMLTNWAGDYGIVKKFALRFPTFNIMGDTTWCGGKVSGKRIDEDQHIVEIEYWNHNQLGITVTDGSAEMVLPSKNSPKR